MSSSQAALLDSATPTDAEGKLTTSRGKILELAHFLQRLSFNSAVTDPNPPRVRSGTWEPNFGINPVQKISLF
jgi:hypothetical protein